jgi:urease accessory protein
MGLSIAGLVAVVGLAGAVFVLVVLVAAFVVRLQSHWARIAVRVGGSWIAASGVLMLGWSLRGG